MYASYLSNKTIRPQSFLIERTEDIPETDPATLERQRNSRVSRVSKLSVQERDVSPPATRRRDRGNSSGSQRVSKVGREKEERGKREPMDVKDRFKRLVWKEETVVLDTEVVPDRDEHDRQWDLLYSVSIVSNTPTPRKLSNVHLKAEGGADIDIVLPFGTTFVGLVLPLLQGSVTVGPLDGCSAAVHCAHITPSTDDTLELFEAGVNVYTDVVEDGVRVVLEM